MPDKMWPFHPPRLRYSTALGLVCLACGVATVAAAQEPGTTTLQEIIVESSSDEAAGGPFEGIVAKRSGSGSKTDTPIVETPQSVSVIGVDEMEQRGVTSVSEALRYTPGVVSTGRPSTRYDIGTIRGFGGSGAFSAQGWFDYLDGMRMPMGGFAAPIMDPWNLERVEVLKGPASVLYGAAIPGGLVNQITKKPLAQASNEVQLRTGYPGRIEGAFDFTGALDADNEFLYRFVGLGRYAEGNVDFSKSERVFLAPSFTWQPSDRTSLTLQAGYLRDPSSTYSPYLPSVGVLTPHPSGHQIPYDFSLDDPASSGFNREQAWIGYQFSHEFTPYLTVRQNVRYMDVETLHRGMAMRGWILDGEGVETTEFSRKLAKLNDTNRQLTADTQAELNFQTGSLDHRLLIGADYQHMTLDRYSGSASFPTIDFQNPIYGFVVDPVYDAYADERRQQFGVYLQDQIRYDDLVVTLNARHDWVDSFYNDYDYDSSTGAKEFYDGDSADQSAFTWRAGAAYLFDNGLAPFASYATSFEPVSGHGFGREPFKPKTGAQFEVGLRYQPTTFTGLFTLSYFDITQKNVLYDTGIEDESCSYWWCQTQVGEVRSRGIELEGKAEVFPGFDVVASYAYTHARIVEGGDGVFAPQSGTTPVAVPTNQAALWVHHSVLDADATFAGLGIGAGVRYVGETYGDFENNFKVPGFALFDAVLSYDFGAKNAALEGLALSVNVSNLLDKKYVASCTEVGNPGFCYYGSGRTATATMSYRW